MANPFTIVSAELMPLADIGKEFVRNHTEYAKLAAHSHTVVWGSRGAGKSIHFRFLEPMAQAHRPDGGFGGNVKEFLSDSNAFIGVYLNCREGLLNREEFRQVAELPNASEDYLMMIFTRYMACAAFRAIACTLTEQMSWTLDQPVSETDLPMCMRSWDDMPRSVFGDVLEYTRNACSTWMQVLRDEVDAHFLAAPDSPSRAAFPKSSPDLVPGIIEFCAFIRSTTKLAVPVFLLFDEANELSKMQQECVASLIACRCQNELCVKVASQLYGFTPRRRFGSDIDETHDYTTIDLESLYTNHQEAYYQRVLDIGNQRLQRCGVEKEIREYLPANPKDEAIMAEARRIAEEHYYAIPEDERPRDKINYIKKYAPAIVFQEIRSSKAAKSYAGFDNTVHLSSGIVRSFLDCCSKMYARFVERHPDVEPDAIPFSIQNEVVAEYSNEFIQSQILAKIEAFDAGQKEERRELEQLHSLLDGLGMLFRERLLDKSSREPRVISVSLKDKPTELLRTILQIAERDAFLHRKWYRSKRGNRNLPCYVLNRRLCPHYNLDLSGFQGRFEVSSEEMSVALEDPSEFVRVLRKRRKSNKEEQEQFTLFEW